MRTEKTTNQIDCVPRMIKNVSPPITGLWYPSARPHKFYRKQGATFSKTTSQPYDTPVNCIPCANSIRVGKQFKLLGKKDNGDVKLPCQTKGPVGSKFGNVINFSGNATIRSATTNLSPTYYSNYKMYLKSRGNTYDANLAIHKIPTVDYSIEPTGDPMDSSHYYKNDPTSKCKLTIYKPNNPTFSCQGGVDSSTYVQRSKYNAIVKNNDSFMKPYGVRMNYQETPIFFQKNKNYVCKVKHRIVKR
jgi:hypothetical protein